MSNLQTYYHFKLDFQKVDQHTGGKWLIHGTNNISNIHNKEANTYKIDMSHWQLKY